MSGYDTFTVSGHGNIYLVTPVDRLALQVLAARVPDDAQWFGRSLVVDQHYISEFVDGLREDGYTVRT